MAPHIKHIEKRLGRSRLATAEVTRLSICKLTWQQLAPIDGDKNYSNGRRRRRASTMAPLTTSALLHTQQ